MTKRIMLAAVCTISILLPVLSQGTDMPAKARPSKIVSQRKSAPSSDGERTFQQNCARCHDAPQSLPPAITGTVIRHMRVRAALSEKDERAILRFMNP